MYRVLSSIVRHLPFSAAALSATSCTMATTTSNAAASGESVVFAGGCFWCVEAPYSALKGIHTVESGYIGGHVKNPSYRDVCSGETGHAEAVKITYDPGVVSYDLLMDVFFTLHDPTQLNRQGNDVGTQYRSAIFYSTDEQEKATQAKIKELEKKLPSAIETTVEPLSKWIWYPAEEYHQVSDDTANRILLPA